MKVECIAAPKHYTLNIGEVYEVRAETPFKYTVYNKELEGEYTYEKDLFNVVLEVNIPSAYAENVSVLEKQFLSYTTIPKRKITYKDFLASMPKDSIASVLLCSDGITNIYAYDLEFVCTTEERAEEVYTALIILFKEP